MLRQRQSECDLVRTVLTKRNQMRCCTSNECPVFLLYFKFVLAFLQQVNEKGRINDSKIDFIINSRIWDEHTEWKNKTINGHTHTHRGNIKLTRDNDLRRMKRRRVKKERRTKKNGYRLIKSENQTRKKKWYGKKTRSRRSPAWIRLSGKERKKMMTKVHIYIFLLTMTMRGYILLSSLILIKTKDTDIHTWCASQKISVRSSKSSKASEAASV